MPLARKELARIIDHTLLAPEATRGELEAHCAEARDHGFAGVCVNGSRVLQAAHFLEGSEVKMICMIAYPLGAADADVKRYETEAAIDSGAHFIEAAANAGRLRDGDDSFVLRELRDIVEAADERPVSILFEPTILTPVEIDRLCRMAREAGVKGLSMSAELNPAATLDAVKQIRRVVGADFGIKVVGARFEMNPVIAFLEAGVTRFGMTGAVGLLQGL
jgi:deoxyribose-phosphate aldolase